MSKLSNTIMLLRLLQNGKKYSIKELASELEVSPRMIRSYKSELECAGIYIESIRGPYGGYYLNQNIKLPNNIDKSRLIPVNKEYFNSLSKAINNRNKCYIENKIIKNNNGNFLAVPQLELGAFTAMTWV